MCASRHKQLFLPKVGVQCRQSSLLDHIHDTLGVMWVEMEPETGVVTREGQPENPDVVLTQSLAAANPASVWANSTTCKTGYKSIKYTKMLHDIYKDKSTEKK